MCYLGFCAINRKTNSSLVKWTENSTPRQEHLKLFIQDYGFTVNGPIYMCCVGWRKLGEPWGNPEGTHENVKGKWEPPPRDTKERQQGQWWEITVSFINIFTAQTSLLVCFFLPQEYSWNLLMRECENWDAHLNIAPALLPRSLTIYAPFLNTLLRVSPSRLLKKKKKHRKAVKEI